MTEPDAVADIPPFRYTAALADEIENRWQDYWEEHGTFHAPNPTGAAGRPGAPAGRAPRSCSCWTCSRTRPAPGCTSGTRWATSAPTATPATSGWPAATCCTRWASTRSACRPSSTRCRPASTRARRPRPTSTGTAAQLRRLGLAYDARRSVATTDPEFYRWTQWIFLQIFNSWYDPARRKARPIAELIAEFAAGDAADARTAGPGPS